MSHRLFPYVILTALLGSIPSAVAGPIAWGAATPISGDGDVSTTGTLVSAYSLNAGAATVNGVTFQSGSGQLSTLGASFGFTGFALQYSGFGSGQAPFSQLSTAYRLLLSNGDYVNSGGVVPVITLRNLTAGRVYAVQVWENDSRPGRGSDFRVTLSSGPNTVDLYQNSSGGDGGTGQFVVGVFTADASTQSFTAQGTFGSNPDTYLNAIQLRDITDTVAATPVFNPEPGGISGATTVTISGESGSTIYYTTDNSTPGLTSSHGEAGSGTATVELAAPASVTIRAFAVHGGKADSTVAAGSYLTAVAGSPRGYATVVNPSFEDKPKGGNDDYTEPHGSIVAATGVPGWQFNSSQGDSYSGIVTEEGSILGSPKDIPQGWQAAFVQGTGRISQTVTFTNPGSYLVRFRARGRFIGGVGAEPITVTVDDNALGTFTPPTSSWAVLNSSPVTLTSERHVVAFSGTIPYSQSDRTTMIDAVQVVTPAEAIAAAPLISPVQNLVFIGDSITAGATLSDPAGQSSSTQCQISLGQRFNAGIRFSNQGHAGSTTGDWQPSSNPGSFFQAAVAAANALDAKEPGRVIFSIMLGTNDSARTSTGLPVPASTYKLNLRAIVDQLLVSRPDAVVFLHHPIWYSPNTQNGAYYGSTGLAQLQTYFPQIDQIVADCLTAYPGHVFAGDAQAFGHFENSYLTELTPEAGVQGTFYLHPNVTGAVALGKYWADVIGATLKLLPNDSYSAWLQSINLEPGTGFLDPMPGSAVASGLAYGVPGGLGFSADVSGCNIVADVRDDATLEPVLEGSGDLLNWSPLPWAVAGESGVPTGFVRYRLTDSYSGQVSRFYRLLLSH